MYISIDLPLNEWYYINIRKRQTKPKGDDQHGSKI